MGSSRISMGFTSSTPRMSDPVSPLSMMPPSTPFSGQYRYVGYRATTRPGPRFPPKATSSDRRLVSCRSHHFATPDSTPGGNSSFAPNSPASSDYRLSSS